jgi:hypothetical protein
MQHATTDLTVSAAVWQRYPRFACAYSLHAQARRYAVLTASEHMPAPAPRYMLTDCHSDGAAAYAAPRYSLAPAYDEWQAMVIDAVRRMRRWRYYADSPD